MSDDVPRRRTIDKDRRRWSDRALDLLGKRVDSHAEDLEELKLELRAVSRLPSEFAAFRREFDEWKLERRDDLVELRTDIRGLRGRIDSQFDRNFREHRKVQETTEQVAEQTQRNPMKDFLIAALAAATGIGVPVAIAVLAGAH